MEIEELIEHFTLMDVLENKARATRRGGAPLVTCFEYGGDSFRFLPKYCWPTSTPYMRYLVHGGATFRINPEYESEKLL